MSYGIPAPPENKVVNVSTNIFRLNTDCAASWAIIIGTTRTLLARLSVGVVSLVNSVLIFHNQKRF